ncbi:MAG TPA: hypothetical protein VKA55_03640 [Gammaproteobacteria bacterium]|nr:hypothetical protein [Gammaproteobacteria bacterium]
MDPETHLADAFSMQMALGSGLIHSPEPHWDPDLRGWVVAARSRHGSHEWVLTESGRPEAFPDRDRAGREADSLGRLAPPFPVG